MQLRIIIKIIFHYLKIYTNWFVSNKGPIQSIIENKLSKFFSPSYLAVVNESYKHSVPKGSESHFKVCFCFSSIFGKNIFFL